MTIFTPLFFILVTVGRCVGQSLSCPEGSLEGTDCEGFGYNGKCLDGGCIAQPIFECLKSGTCEVPCCDPTFSPCKPANEGKDCQKLLDEISQMIGEKPHPELYGQSFCHSGFCQERCDRKKFDAFCFDPVKCKPKNEGIICREDEKTRQKSKNVSYCRNGRCADKSAGDSAVGSRALFILSIVMSLIFMQHVL